MNKFLILFFILILTGAYNASAKKYTVYRNIFYASGEISNSRQMLDIYAPKDKSRLNEVFIFIHGGSWRSGRKEIYSFIGRRMAEQGKVAILINYRLAPGVNIKEMEKDCAKAVKWVYQNIDKYGGNKNGIFISGHSAGGQLAALLTVRNNAFDSLNLENPIRGCILNDAFGLDMFTYLSKAAYKNDTDFYKSFTKDPATWKFESPIYQIKNTQIPFLIFIGEKTYFSIKISNGNFMSELKAKNIKSDFYTINKRGHVPMILQMYFKRNELYEKILKFMESS